MSFQVSFWKSLSLYKLYNRPHIDYGDVIHQIPNKDDSLHCHGNVLMQKIKSLQYSAALAITGSWRGTSREKFYCESVEIRCILEEGVGDSLCCIK